jgi:DNA-binding transcriptional LysR family regulator
VTELREGRIDMAIATATLYEGARPPPGLFVQTLFSDRFVCVVRDDHPVVKRRLGLDEFCDLPHALVSPRGEGPGVVDLALAKIGRKRRVALHLPHFLVAPHIVRETDVVLTLAERVANVVAPLLGLRRVPTPLEVGGFSMAMAWHEQNHADPAHAWMRALAADVARRLPSPGRATERRS